jgi:hypothetical protein
MANLPAYLAEDAAAVRIHATFRGYLVLTLVLAVGVLLVSCSTSSLMPAASEVLDVGDLDVGVVELRVGCLDDFLSRRDVPVLVAETRKLPAMVTYRLLLLLLRW